MNEDTLRQILTAEADRVEVAPDALGTIRRRVRARSRRRLFAVPAFALAGGAAAAAVAVAVAVANSAPPVHRAEPGPAASEPLPAATATRVVPPPVGSGQPAASMVAAAVPVYFVGMADGEPRLYREFHRLKVGGGTPAERAAAAVAEMLRGIAYGEYGSSWPGITRLLGAGAAGDVVTVDLTGVDSPDDDGKAHPVALQQLVYTATAAADADGLRLLVDGKPVDKLWGSVPAAGVLRRAPVADVLGPVWIIGPQQGEAVGRTFTVHLAGIVWEGTVQLRVRGKSGPVTRVVQLSVGAPAQGEARVPLTLAPGEYTLEAYYLSARDDQVEHGLDAHRIRVR